MQKKDIPEVKIQNSVPEGHGSGVPFSSNYVRLPGREWVIVGIVFLAIFCLAPALWERFEKFEPGPDYRLPYELGYDYWFYNRYCRWACSRYETLVIGDSVVWGHYVTKGNTLSHYLNESAGRNEFANLGVDGIHPVALAGLLKYYGRQISEKNVILHFNPLWMSSIKHDLQTTKEFHFNHPRLVPQFTPNIPCYKDSYSKKFSAVVERYVTFLSWTSHLKINYFGSMDLSTWTLEHPYQNPLGAVTFELPPSRNDGPQEHVSWEDRGISTQDFQWVEPYTSLQWSFFRQTIKLLQARKNTVFVLVGPFNEHMFKRQSAEVYRRMQNEIADWLSQNNVAFFMPPALPSELYSDASHPSAEGYALIAKQLFENQPFRSNVLGSVVRRSADREVRSVRSRGDFALSGAAAGPPVLARPRLGEGPSHSRASRYR